MLNKMIRGGIAGLMGGLVFGLWMSDKGVLPMIAKLVGGASPTLGFFVHMVISALIGASFGFLFNRRVEDQATGILWGLVYGFVWWALGPLTLMPVGLGMGPQWTAAAVSSTIPSLLWHVVFGGITGLAFFSLKAKVIDRVASRAI